MERLLSRKCTLSLPASENVGGAVHLRELARERLLDGMLKTVSKMCSNPLAAGAHEGPQSMRPQTTLLVVDSTTARIVESCCEMSDLFKEGVCLIERIEADRSPLPLFDAIYFITPSDANLELLVRDAEYMSMPSRSQQSRPMYASFHAFFPYRINERALSTVAASKEAAAKMDTFAELGLAFAPYDARCFALGDDTRLQGLFSGYTPSTTELEQTACGIASLLATLGDSTPNIFYSSQGIIEARTEALAKEVQKRVEELHHSGGSQKFATEPPLDVTFVIVDRSVDWGAVFAYDMTYEPILWDLLGNDAAYNTGQSSLPGNRYCYQDESDAEKVKTAIMTPEHDPYYGLFRHSPMWRVNEDVVDGVQKWTARDSVIRERTSGMGNATTGSKVSSTLTTLQELPEHQLTFEKLHLHSQTCQRCTEHIEADSLVDVARVMQDLLCDDDQGTLFAAERPAVKDMKQILVRNDVGMRAKARLLLVNAVAPPGMEEGDLAILADQHLSGHEAEVLRHPACEILAASAEGWWDLQFATSPEYSNTKTPAPDSNAKRSKAGKAAAQKAGHNIGPSTPRSKELCRYEPLLTKIIEGAYRQELDDTLFQMLPPRAHFSNSTDAKETETKEKQRCVVVYVVGGVTLPEARVAQQASQSLGIEAFVGGCTLLTPSLAMDSLLRATIGDVNDLSDEYEELGK
eukprot:TRINITY_DN23848_c0_g7_i1.p1 TRINITY_DN23848_c0_g7~~TRINITY_DN23848_c0_g7_i1.p1  ORF type:complete len:691 (-),score=103.42 TRINITY_DN23848_c0_g7_i1:109-2181(-)